MNERRPDVLIIGGGIVGLSVAYYTALKGADVLVLEKGDAGSGASSGNAGLVVPSFFEPLSGPGVLGEAVKNVLNSEGFFGIRPRSDPFFWGWLLHFGSFCSRRDFSRRCRVLAELNREALKTHLELAMLGGESYEFSKSGLLYLYSRKAGVRDAREKAARAADLGFKAEILSADEVRHEEPAAGERVAGGVRTVSDARLNPQRFTAWLTKRVREAGGNLETQCEVYGFRTSGKRLHSVLTTRGEFRGEQVVLAGGAWLRRLGRMLGIHLPVEGGMGISQTFHDPGWSVKRPLILGEHHVAVSPLEGALRVTGLLELSGTDLTLTPRRVTGIRKAARLYLPALTLQEPDEVWRGLRPCTPDGLPLLGRIRTLRNVFVAGGHDTKGMTLGPITGRYLSGLLTGEAVGPVQQALSPQRFSI